MTTINELLTKFQNLVKKYHYTKTESDDLITIHNNSNDAHNDIRNSIPSRTSDLVNDCDFITSNEAPSACDITIIDDYMEINGDGIYIIDNSENI